MADTSSRTGESPSQKFVAVVAQPVKSDMDALREAVRTISEQAGWGAPRFYETTVEDPGRGQAKEALEAGASIVASSGGDGTACAVAEVLAGTGVPMALLPAGTGNLLARAIGVSHNSRTAALALLTEGRPRQVDIMSVDMVRPDGSRFTETSVVGLGIGYNADLMAGTDETLKKRAGWFAYIVSGVRAIRTHAVKARVAGDVTDPSRSLAASGARVRNIRSILVVTCGLLVGGLRLLEDSEPDDGVMETVVATPKSRFALILQLGRLIARRDARGPDVDVIRSSKNVVVECPRGTVAQIDGDPVGHVVRIEVTLRPGVLTVLSP